MLFYNLKKTWSIRYESYRQLLFLSSQEMQLESAVTIYFQSVEYSSNNTVLNISFCVPLKKRDQGE